jgi:hypothetical protein
MESICSFCEILKPPLNTVHHSETFGKKELVFSIQNKHTKMDIDTGTDTNSFTDPTWTKILTKTLTLTLTMTPTLNIRESIIHILRNKQ